MPTPHEVHWSALSHTGKFRKDNEDAFLALLIEDRQIHRLGKFGEATIDGREFIFAVSDGMGGANAGEFASRIAVEMLTRFTSTDSLPKEDNACQEFLKNLFQHIHKEILYQANSYEECKGMGATLSLCLLQQDKLHFCHVGDSRIYRYSQAEETDALTHDDTHVGWLYKQGKLNEHQARQHPRRCNLQQVLGGKTQFLTPQTGSLATSQGETYLLCTDGVVEGMANRALRRNTLKPNPGSEQTTAERIVFEAIEQDGRDNTTALVFRMK